MILGRRAFLLSGAAAAGVAATRASGQPGMDITAILQRAIDAAGARGGGTVEVPGTFPCRTLVMRDRVTLRGGRLINARIVVPKGCTGCRLENLEILDRRGDVGSFALDVVGRDCVFAGVTLIKDPVAGGYQMYLRQESSGCRFDRLKLKGSNGIMVAGRNHLFENFELESTMSNRVGGDDAFAIKGLGAETSDIVIRNGIVRGFAAAVSFGSEIGSSREHPGTGSVRRVTVSDVVADRCGSLAFFKPGALIYDWRNGLVEEVRLERMRLNDEEGAFFTSGVRMIAARGAVIRNVTGRDLTVRARAKNQDVQPTAAIDLTFLAGADARIENVDIALTFLDPYDGAPHGPRAPGYPVDHIVRIEKENPERGTMRGISLDVAGRGSRFGGVYVGRGVDDAVTLRRAKLERVGMNPPASAGGGGVWADSRVRLGDISIDSPVLPRFGGRALGNRR